VADDQGDQEVSFDSGWIGDEYRALSCQRCGLPRVFRRRRVRHSLHFMLALATVGLWLPVWGLIIILQGFNPWVCTVCGVHQRRN
jgi:hypothetical protein